MLNMGGKHGIPAASEGSAVIRQNMDWKDFKLASWLDEVDVDSIPVQVVGTKEEGYWEFRNLRNAQERFAELNVREWSDNFTSAMRGDLNGRPALRFETVAAYREFSV